MKLTRLVWVAAALCALGLTLAAAPSPAIEPKLLPNDTEVIVTINFRQILGSEVAKANKELVDLAKQTLTAKLGENGADKYLEKLGFDLFKDLDSVTIASPGSKNPESLMIFIEGKFNAEKLQAAGEDAIRENADAIKAVKIGGVQAYQINPKQGEEKPFFAGLVGNNMLVATGSKEAFADAVARNGGTRQSKLKQEFKGLLDTVNKKQSFSMVATGAALGRLLEDAPIPNAEAAMAGLQQIEGLSVAVTVEKDVAFQLGVNTKDKATAEQFAKAGNGGLQLVKLMAEKKRTEDPDKFGPVADIAKTLRLTSQGSNVMLRGEISFENLGKIIQNLPKKE